jgi:signal transduction histidine kinase
MLQQLLNVSRGKSDASEVCSLREVIEAAWATVAPAADARKIELEMEVPDHVECLMERARIERVFSNLFENAIDAMRSGGKVLIQSLTDHDNVLVRVEDTGPGISPVVRARLFQPFVTAGKKNGLGLGLALSRQTLLDHGGDIWAEGDGPGARFCLRLPKERSATSHESSKVNGDGVVAGD